MKTGSRIFVEASVVVLAAVGNDFLDFPSDAYSQSEVQLFSFAGPHHRSLITQ